MRSLLGVVLLLLLLLSRLLLLLLFLCSTSVVGVSKTGEPASSLGLVPEMDARDPGTRNASDGPLSGETCQLGKVRCFPTDDAAGAPASTSWLAAGVHISPYLTDLPPLGTKRLGDLLNA